MGKLLGAEGSGSKGEGRGSPDQHFGDGEDK